MNIKFTKHCETCEVLQQMLTTEQFTNKKLLDKILELTQPKIIIQDKEPEEPVNYQPKQINWRMRKEMLEAEDRNKAKLIREAAKNEQRPIEELEVELGVNDASNKQ